MFCSTFLFCFFFNDTATTEIYTLSLHDALPIYSQARDPRVASGERPGERGGLANRSEEHTSELQSLAYLVCRLLLEKKQNTRISRFVLAGSMYSRERCVSNITN